MNIWHAILVFSVEFFTWVIMSNYSYVGYFSLSKCDSISTLHVVHESCLSQRPYIVTSAFTNLFVMSIKFYPQLNHKIPGLHGITVIWWPCRTRTFKGGVLWVTIYASLPNIFFILFAKYKKLI